MINLLKKEITTKVNLKKQSLTPLTDSIINKLADLQDYPPITEKGSTKFKGYIFNINKYYDLTEKTLNFIILQSTIINI